MQDCEICRGARVIRLPRYQKVAMAVGSELPATVECSYREYACPECGTKANVERVFALDAYVSVDSRVPADAMDHVKRSAAHRLVDQLLDGGFIEFESGKEDRRFMRRPMIATVWVVQPGEGRRSIEDRIRERQDQFAKVVMDEAIQNIAIWGMHHGWVEIRKEDAARFIRGAFKKVSDNWSKEAQLRAEGKINVEA